jgi:hypothetical protein
VSVVFYNKPAWFVSEQPEKIKKHSDILKRDPLPLVRKETSEVLLIFCR